MGNMKLYGIVGHVTKVIDSAWLKEEFHSEYATVTFDSQGYLGVIGSPWMLGVVYSHSIAANRGMEAFAAICTDGVVSMVDYDYPEMFCCIIKDCKIVSRYVGDLRKIPPDPLSIR